MIHVTLERVGEARAECLRRLMSHDLYEMSGVYGGAPDEDGEFKYPYLPLYFTELERHPYWILMDGERAGFVTVNARGSVGDAPCDHAAAEFTLFPSFRGRGIAPAAMDRLTELLPGHWQLKFSPENRAGAGLWQGICRKYGGTLHALPENEIGLTFDRP